MDLKTLQDTPSWEWPEDTAETLLRILRDDRRDESDRLIAAELAGDFVVINDELASELLSILCNSHESEKLRGKAAISFGPALEQADTDGFDEPDDAPITEQTFHILVDALHRLYLDVDVPKEVRRRVLEASVRAQSDWHRDAVLKAYSSEDENWKLTAVFCMRFLRGFDDQILESLDSKNPEIHYEAVCAAGNWEMDGAWSHVVGLVTSERTEKHLLLAAIEALPFIRPKEATEILCDIESDDEDIAEAIKEAMMAAETFCDEDDPLLN